MRLVLAIIQPTKLAVVQEALARIGVERMTICDAQGYAQEVAGENPARLLRKVALEIAVNEDFLDGTVETITLAARSGPAGDAGDGSVFVLPLDQVVRLSDAVCGPEAVS